MKTISKDVPACFTIESLVVRVTFELFVKPTTDPEWASAQEAPGSRWARPRSTQGPSEPTAQERQRAQVGQRGGTFYSRAEDSSITYDVGGALGRHAQPIRISQFRCHALEM